MTPAISLKVVADDPTDDRFLECAVEAGADYLVSGDVHLLRLGQYAGVQILSPGAFVQLGWGEAPADRG